MANGKGPLTPEQFFNYYNRGAVEPSISGRQTSTPEYGIRRYSPVDLSEYSRLVPDPVLTGQPGLDESVLAERRARNQGRFEKWRNGAGKFIGKTATNIAGGLAMLPTTIGVAGAQVADIFTEGETVKWSDIYDNAFQRAMDSANEWMTEYLPNYRTAAEREMNFWKSLGTANFWADDFLGGMSFLVGAVLTEGAAASSINRLIPKAVKLGKTLERSAKADDVLKAYQAAGRRNKIFEMGRIPRQMITGAGFEAGVEARHFRTQAVEDLTSKFVQENGREPNKDELDGIVNRANAIANGVFAANLVTVSLGNMVTLAKTFSPLKRNIRTVNPSRFIKKDGQLVAKSATKWGRIKDTVKAGIIRPTAEAGEEFTQSLIQSTAMDFVMNRYSPEGADNIYQLFESLGEGFNQTMDSKDAWKETGIGFMLGLLGVPGLSSSNLGDAYNAATGRASSTDAQIADRYNNAQTVPIFNAAMKNAIQQYEMQQHYNQAVEMGDMFKAKNVENMQLFGWLSSRDEVGLLEDDLVGIQEQMNEMSAQEFREQFGINDTVTDQEIEQRKTEVVESLNTLAKEYRSAKNLAGRVVDNPADKLLQEGLAFSLFQLKNLDNREQQLITDLSQVTQNLSFEEFPESVRRLIRQKYKKGEKLFSTKELAQILEDNDYANAVDLKRILSDPITRADVDLAMMDLQRIIALRTKLTEEYNLLSSKKGQKKFSELSDTLRNESMKRVGVDLAYNEKRKQRALDLVEEIEQINEKINRLPKPGQEGHDIQAAELNRLVARQEQLSKKLEDIYGKMEPQAFSEFADEGLALQVQEQMSGDDRLTAQDYQSTLFRQLGAFASNFPDVQKEVNKELDTEEEPDTPTATQDSLGDETGMNKKYDELIRLYRDHLNEEQRFQSDQVLRFISTEGINSDDIDIEVRIEDYNPEKVYHQDRVNKNLFLESGVMFPDGTRKTVLLYGKYKDGDWVQLGALLDPERFVARSGDNYYPLDPNNSRHLRLINPSMSHDNTEGRKYTEIFNGLKQIWDKLKRTNPDKLNKSEFLSTFAVNIYPFNLIPSSRRSQRPLLKDTWTPKEHGFIEIDGKKALVVMYPKGNVDGVPHHGVYYKVENGEWQQLTDGNIADKIKQRRNDILERRTKTGSPEQQNKAMLLVQVNGIDEFVNVDVPILPESNIAEVEDILEDALGVLRKVTAKNTSHKEMWEEVVEKLGIEEWQVDKKGNVYGENKPIALTPKVFSLPLTLINTETGKPIPYDTHVKVFINKGPKNTGFDIVMQPYELGDGKRQYINFRQNKQGDWYAQASFDGKKYSSTIGPELTLNAIRKIFIEESFGPGRSILQMLEDSGIRVEASENMLADPTIVGFDDAPVQAIPDLKAMVSPRYYKPFGKTNKKPPKGRPKFQPLSKGKSFRPAAESNSLDEAIADGKFGDAIRMAISQGMSKSDFIGYVKDQMEGDPNLADILPTLAGLFDREMSKDSKDDPVENTSKRAQEEASSEENIDNPSKLFGKPKGKKPTGRPKFKRFKDDDPGFSIVTEEPEGYSLQEAIENLKTILDIRTVDNPDGVFEIEHIERLVSALYNNGITMGAFFNNTIYLLKGGAEFHEAFHAIFRTLLNTNERSSLYDKALEKFGEPTAEQIEDLKKKSPSYQGLSKEEMRLLVLEEQMANDFNAYAIEKTQSKSVFARMWNKIVKWLKSLLVAQDGLELMYDKILRGDFKGVKPSDPVHTTGPAFAILDTVAGREGVLELSKVGMRDSQMVINQLAKNLMSQGILNPSKQELIEQMQELSEFYDPDNWWEELMFVNEQYGIDQFAYLYDRLLSISNALNSENEFRVRMKGTDDVGLLGSEDALGISNADLIFQEIKQKLSFYERPEDTPEDEESENDVGNATELFHRAANKYGGFQSESRAMRQYLSFISADTDYFGMGLNRQFTEGNQEKYQFPLDSQTIYNGLLNALKNVNKVNDDGTSKMLQVGYELSRYGSNRNFSFFFDQLFSDISSELGLEEGADLLTLSHEELSQSNYYNLFVGAFNKVETDNYELKVDTPDPDNNRNHSLISVFNAATADSARQQFDRWYANWRRFGYSREQLLRIVDVNLPGLVDPEVPDVVSPAQFERFLADKVDRTKELLFDGLGIDVSDLLIRYSIIKNLHANKKISRDNAAFDGAYRTLDNFVHVEDLPHLSREFFSTALNEAVKRSDNGDIYATSDRFQESRQAAIGRLLGIAYMNTYFDERVRINTLQNAENENIYSIHAPSFDTKWAQMFSDVARQNPEFFQQFRDLLRKEKFEDAYYFYEEIIGNRLTTDWRRKQFFEAIKRNPLLLGNYDFTNFRPGNIMGSKPFNAEEEFSWRQNESGTSFHKLDIASKLMTMMSLYADSSKTFNSRGLRLIMPAVLEVKSTTRVIPLPYNEDVLQQETDQEGVLSTSTLQGFYNHLVIEYERIQRVKDEIRDILAGRRTTEIVNNYHHVNGVIRNPDNPNEYFRMIPQWEKVNGENVITGYEFEDVGEDQYKKPRGLKLFHFSRMPSAERIEEMAYADKPLDELTNYYGELQQFINTQFDRFMEEIASTRVGLIRKEGDKYVNRYLPNVPNGFSYVYPDGTVNEVSVKRFFVEDYLNSLNFNNIFLGDPALTHKDFTDVTKRNGGLIAAGNEMGGSTTKVALIADKEPTLSDERLLKSGKDTTTEVQDGQTYASSTWYMNKYLTSTSKLNPKVKKVILKVQAGIRLTRQDVKVLQSNAALLNDRKIVVRGLLDYIKTSAHIQSREKVSYISPWFMIQHGEKWQDKLLDLWDQYNKSEDYDKPRFFNENLRKVYEPVMGYEYHHNMMNTMDTFGLGMVSVTSASKMMSQDIGNVDGSNNFYVIPYEISDLDVREQVKTDSVKNEIIHSTQTIGLIWSEQQADADLSVQGIGMKAGKAADLYRKLLARRGQEGFYEKRQTIFDNNYEVKYNELWEKIKSSLEQSGADVQLIKLFEVIANQPVYNWNLPSVYKKLQQMYLRYASTGTLSHRVPGYKYTLVSDEGHKIVRDTKTGRVIPKFVYFRSPEKYERSKRYSRDRLQFAVKDGNSFYSEVIVPQGVLDDFGLKIGDEIPDKVAQQLGVRIPTQDKHSMARMRIVDVLPRMYGTSLILPREAVFLAGEDFDIDAKYSRRFDTVTIDNNPVIIGSYLEMEHPDEAIQRAAEEYEQVNGESIELDKISAQVQRNREHFRQGNWDRIDPVSGVRETNNLLLSLESELAMNQGNLDEAMTPADTTMFKEAEELFKSFGVEVERETFGVSSALDKLIATETNFTGNAGIGPTALWNVLFQHLKLYNVRLMPQVVAGELVEPEPILGEYNSFNDFINHGRRVNDIISSTLTAMTDNPILLIAAKFNLSADNLGTFLTLVTMGVQFETALMIMRQPSVVKLTNELKRQRSQLKNKAEIKLERKSQGDSLESWIQEDFPDVEPIDLTESNAYTKLKEALTWATENNWEVGVTEEITSEGTLNVYHSTDENAHLSNFAKRPFTDSGSVISFDSVEQAFQWYKSRYAPDTPANRQITEKILNSDSSGRIKRLGGQYDELDTEAWDRDAPGIMKRLIKESFEANPKAKEQLLETRGAKITHTQDKGKWGRLFPKLLMEVRAELGNSAVTEQTPAAPEEFLQVQKAAALLFDRASTLNEELRQMSTVLALIKGMKSTWEENESFYQALDNMGIKAVIQDSDHDSDRDFEVRWNEDAEMYEAFFEGPYGKKVLRFSQIRPSNFNLIRILRQDEFVFTEAAIRIITELDSGQVFISNTEGFKEIREFMSDLYKQGSLNFVQNAKALNESILSALNAHAYRNLTGYVPDAQIMFDMFLNEEDQEIGLIEHLVTQLKNDPSYEKNPFLNFIRFRDIEYQPGRVYTRGATGPRLMFIAEGNTRTKEDPDYRTMIIDGYTDLISAPVSDNFEDVSDLFNKFSDALIAYRETNDYDPLRLFFDQTTASDRARLTSKLIFDYLMVRDGMRYRNNSLVNNLDPIAFKRYAKSLDVVQDLFAGRNSSFFYEQLDNIDFDSVFGMTREQFELNLAELIVRNYENRRSMKYISQGRIYGLTKDKATNISPLRIDRTDQALHVSLFAGTNKKNGKERNAEIIQSNKRMLMKTELFSQISVEGKTELVFPYAFATQVKTKGTTGRNKVYRLRKISRGKTDITDPLKFKDKQTGKIIGTYAEYELVDYFADRQITPVVFNPNELEELPSRIGQVDPSSIPQNRNKVVKIFSEMSTQGDPPIVETFSGQSYTIEQAESFGLVNDQGNIVRYDNVAKIIKDGETLLDLSHLSRSALAQEIKGRPKFTSIKDLENNKEIDKDCSGRPKFKKL